MIGGPLDGVADGRTIVSAPGNPLAPRWRLPEAPPGATVVAWSGTLADDLDAAHPRNWMSPGRDALEAAAPRLRAAADAAGVSLLLAPHARHVLNDIPSVARYAREHDESAPALALLPAALLEPGMLPDVEDHLVRILGDLGPVARLVVLEDARPSDDGGSIERVALGDGVLPRSLLEALAARHAAGIVVRRAD